jgi:hypothetical protein
MLTTRGDRLGDGGHDLVCLARRPRSGRRRGLAGPPARSVSARVTPVAASAPTSAATTTEQPAAPGARSGASTVPVVSGGRTEPAGEPGPWRPRASRRAAAAGGGRCRPGRPGGGAGPGRGRPGVGRQDARARRSAGSPARSPPVTLGATRAPGCPRGARADATLRGRAPLACSGPRANNHWPTRESPRARRSRMEATPRSATRRPPSTARRSAHRSGRERQTVAGPDDPSGFGAGPPPDVSAVVGGQRSAPSTALAASRPCCWYSDRAYNPSL